MFFSGYALNLAVDEIIRLVMSNLYQVFQMMCLWMASNQMQHLSPRLESCQRSYRMRSNQYLLCILMRMADKTVVDGKKEALTMVACLHQCHQMALVSWYVAMAFNIFCLHLALNSCFNTSECIISQFHFVIINS